MRIANGILGRLDRIARLREHFERVLGRREQQPIDVAAAAARISRGHSVDFDEASAQTLESHRPSPPTMLVSILCALFMLICLYSQHL